VLHSGLESKIRSIEIGGVEAEEAFAQQSVVLQLEDDIDISRGDLIVKKDNQPLLGQDLEVYLCWMDSKPLVPGNKYYLQINSRVVRASVKEIEFKLDVNSLLQLDAPGQAVLNDVIKVRIRTASPIPYDHYKDLRTGGGAILIDETSLVTVGACMIQ